MVSFRRVCISDLRRGDFFAFKMYTRSHNGYILSSVDSIGADMFRVRYSSTRRWRSYTSVLRGSSLVYVPNLGSTSRFYQHH